MWSGDDTGNMNATFVAKLFVAEGLVVPVVGKEKDDGVLKLTFFFQSFEDVFDLFVGATGGVVVKGPSFLQSRSLREIRREFHGLIRKLMTFANMPIAGLAAPKHDLAKPWLVFIRAGGPGAFTQEAHFLGFVALPSVQPNFIFWIGTYFVELAAIIVKVVVVLSAVEGEVASLTHQFGNRFHSFGEVNADLFGNDPEFAGRAMLVGAGGGLHHSGDHGRAAGRANRGGHVGPFEDDTAVGKGIEDRGVAFVDGVVVATEERREIFDKDPKDVGFLR
jgi:hypothetical protein